MTTTTFPMTLADIPGVYAQPDPATLAKLPKPTKKDNPKGKCDQCGGWHGLPAIHIDYMGHADVTLALINIDPEWEWEPAAIVNGEPVISNQNGRLVMWGYLTLLGHRKLGVGTCPASQPDPEKELIGDLLRNVAMRFGIGTRLWSKSDGADPAGSGVAGGYGEQAAAPSKPKGTARQVADQTVPQNMMARLQILMKEAGLAERDDRLAYVRSVIGREVVSSKECTRAEVSKLIDALVEPKEGRA